MRIIFLSTCLLLLSSVISAAAQVGETTDILTGQVIGPDGEPLFNAAVAAISLETGVRRSTLTNAQGRYTLLFPNGHGLYEMQVSRIGMATAVVLIEALASEDRIVTNVQLGVAPVTLEEILVQADAQRVAPGTQQRELEGDWLLRMPIDAGNLAAVAELEAGVVGLESTDSIGSGGFSILGQGPDLNNVSVDGATFGSPRGGSEGELGLPPEAVRLTRVITNSYDVGRGQFSGGQISATTRGGSNRQQGSFSYSLYEPRLQWDPSDSPFSRAFTQHRVNATYGGPVVQDKVFYFFSGTLRYRSQDFASLVQADAAALEQLGTHPDSVARFLGILDRKGLSPFEPVPVEGQLLGELSLFGRFDFTLSDRHSLMVRADGRSNHRDGQRVTSLGLPHSGGNDVASGAGLMLSLTSNFTDELINEFRAYVSGQSSDAEPYFPVPEGRVRVVSNLDDGTRSVSNLVFGGNRSLPVTSVERSLEMTNELSRLIGDQHRLKLGGLLSLQSSAQEFSPTQYGTFTFTSLEAFEESRPASFARSLTSNTRFGGGANFAVYLGDVWQYSRELQLTYGLRGEGSFFGRAPDFNPAIDSLFARRTDHFPSEVAVSPRFGFTYTKAPPAPRQPAPMTIRGGLGSFRGRPPFSLYSTAMDATGLPDAQVEIVCIGDAVPTPDWAFYRNDAANIPDRCADGEATQRASGSAPHVTVFAPGFSAPVSWRASLEVERRLTPNFSLSASSTHNWGRNLYSVTDLNLDTTPRFHLAAEGSRPVFVDPERIVERNGSLSMINSRLHPEFGQVLEIHSDLRSRSSQWSTSMRWSRPRRLTVNASYTYATVRDESSFSCCAARQGFSSPTTDGNPNVLAWARGNNERRHTISTNVTWTVRPWADLRLNARVNSGTPFTPLVGGDINGDGARNDRAFLYDPAVASDAALVDGMTRLLADASPRIRQCLERQLGEVAGRNSCIGPRTTSMEVRANLSPELPGIAGDRMTISIASQNFLTGLDQLVSGAGQLRGWGQRSSPDNTLLYTRGFDPVTRNFEYEVNERFGHARQGRIPFGSPFQLHVEARVSLGPQRR
jgi:hypothetical protein